MNVIEEIKDKLAAKYPTALLEIDEPMTSAGIWNLDITLDKKIIYVEWYARSGEIGVTRDEDDEMFSGPHQTYNTLDAALTRISEILD